jgi:hypothetical protein
MFGRPVAIGAITALAVAAVLGIGGPALFASAPARAATSQAGTTSVEAALGVAPSAVALAAVGNRTAAGLTSAAAVSAKSAPALSAASLPLVKPKGVSKPAAKAAAKPAAKHVTKAKATARAKKAPAKKKATAKKVRKKAKAKAKKKTSAPLAHPGGGSGAERWRPVVRAYLKKAGVWSQSFEDKAIHIMRKESSGNPSCVSGDYVGLYQFSSSWMSRAARLDPYKSIARFVRVYKEGGIAAIKYHWAPTYY